MNYIKKMMKFYNFDELSTEDDSKIIVKFDDSVDSVTYSDLSFNNQFDLFEYKMRILIDFIKRILDKVSDKNCIIIKYNEKWVVNKTEVPELVKLLDNSLVTNKLKGGLLVDKNDKILELFLESVFKYNSFIQILLKDSKIIISPSDHMDIFFQSDNINELENLIIYFLKLYGKGTLKYEIHKNLDIIQPNEIEE